MNEITRDSKGVIPGVRYTPMLGKAFCMKTIFLPRTIVCGLRGLNSSCARKSAAKDAFERSTCSAVAMTSITRSESPYNNKIAEVSLGITSVFLVAIPLTNRDHCPPYWNLFSRLRFVSVK